MNVQGGPYRRAWFLLSPPHLVMLASSLALLGPALSPATSRAIAAEAPVDHDPEKSARQMITPAAQDAVDRGLKFLADAQHEDGTFGSGGHRNNVAVCGLAGLAFMSSGSTPGRGPFGGHVDLCVDYVLKNTQESGFVVSPGYSSHGPMYGHGFATLFLAEACGMSMRDDLREKLSKAVKLIVNTQNSQGGWRYQPLRADADLSVTICQVMALRAARNAGIHVPNETIDRCIAYVIRSQNPDGGFMYTLQPPGPSGFARSAAGVVALYSAGVYEGPEINQGIDYLIKFKPGPSDGAAAEVPVQMGSFYFYGHYYAVQAMWQRGGEPWNQWYPAIRDELIEKQQENGSWISPISYEYATAMACIVLQLPNNYVPIFQR
jgi:prenyltransferase beta subunit